jgi:2-acylglycerol O-acyltransferase 2
MDFSVRVKAEAFFFFWAYVPFFHGVGLGVSVVTLVLGVWPQWMFVFSYTMLPLIIIYVPFFLLDGAESRMDNWYQRVRLQEWRGLWEVVHKYFKMTPIGPGREAIVEEGKQYIFAGHPHPQYMPLGSWSFFVSPLFEEMFPAVRVRFLAHRYIFLWPFVREMALLSGFIHAGRETAEKAMESGCTVGVFPGGASEAVDATNDPQRLVLLVKGRSGFCRLALKYGVPIVPFLVFGENRLWTNPPAWTGLVRIRRFLYDHFRLDVPFLAGRYFSLIPLPSRISHVFGEPIPVERVDGDVTPSQIHQLHTQYLQALEELFHKHKVACGEREDYQLCML